MVLGCEIIGPEGGHAAGRALLARLYREYTGNEMPPIAVTDRGKPCFTQGTLHFSISHTRRRVFCALSENPVGVDAEELDRRIRPELARKILSASERRQYDAAPDPHLALLTFWVLKEAQAKLTGEGLRGYPNHTDFSLDDPRVRVENECLLAVLEEPENKKI